MSSNAGKAIDHESVNFYEQLLSASMHHGKYAPLWRQTENERGGAIIRIKTLQHMNVIHLRKLLADEVAIMVRSQSTDDEQMRLIEDLMSRYGLQDLAIDVSQNLPLTRMISVCPTQSQIPTRAPQRR